MSNSQGSHRAARGRGRTSPAGTRGPATVVVPGPSPVPPHTVVVPGPSPVPPHEELTLAAWPRHTPTVVDMPAGRTAAATGGPGRTPQAGGGPHTPIPNPPAPTPTP
ncbi:hypothetical protein ACWD3X_17360, partial [Streptomyces sp. NPDC002666]